MVSRRSKVLKASVTEQEMLSVRHAAKKNGVSVSEFIRRLLQPTREQLHDRITAARATTNPTTNERAS